MADQLPAESCSNKNLLCGWLTRGFCRNGDSCEFSHDPAVGVQIPDNVCIFNLQEKCANGLSCRFEHWSAEDILNNYYYFGGDEEEEEEVAETVSEQQASSSSSCPAVEPSSRTRSSQTSGHSPAADASTSSSAHCAIEEEDHSCPRKAALVPFSRVPTSGQESEPKPSKTYAQVTGIEQKSAGGQQEDRSNDPLCPFAFNSSDCPSRQTCRYLHGHFCDLCNRCCLHPFSDKQRRDHREECLKEHEKQMELSFAIQRSMDKNCGICMDTIMEKDPPSARRFGILEKCTHVFCLTCIRKWRMTKQFDNRTIRSCPECRISSDFVIPSEFWVETKDDKDSLISEYKKAMSAKACKHFNQGRGECPFGNACFYLHQYPDGSKAVLPPPNRTGRRLRRSDTEESRSLMDVLLWNYLETRDDPSWLLSLDLDDLLDMRDMGLLSSTDDESDFSEYDVVT